MQPRSLKSGDTIAIVCTAKSVEKDYIEQATKMLNEWGLNVVTGRHLFEKHFQFAGTDEQRLEDFQNTLNDENIQAILCARGGYGTIRIIDNVDFSSFAKNPKWIIGFSDITVLHNHIQTHLGIETLHSTVPIDFEKSLREGEALSTLKEVLFKGEINYNIPSHPLNRPGEAEGIFIGGNLSILHNLTGTNSDIDTKGKILFIEDLCEYAYHVDRMMWNLKKSGKLNQLAGLVVGAFTDIKQGPIPFGNTAYEIILEAVKDYTYPVLFNFPAGHIADNRALIMGRNVKLEVSSTSNLSFHGSPQ